MSWFFKVGINWPLPLVVIEYMYIHSFSISLRQLKIQHMIFFSEKNFKNSIHDVVLCDIAIEKMKYIEDLESGEGV